MPHQELGQYFSSWCVLCYHCGLGHVRGKDIPEPYCDAGDTCKYSPDVEKIQQLFPSLSHEGCAWVRNAILANEDVK